MDEDREEGEGGKVVGGAGGEVAGGGVAVKKEEGSEGEEEMDIGEDEVRYFTGFTSKKVQLTQKAVDIGEDEVRYFILALLVTSKKVQLT
jgi:hypothetical protein